MKLTSHCCDLGSIWVGIEVFGAKSINCLIVSVLFQRNRTHIKPDSPAHMSHTHTLEKQARTHARTHSLLIACQKNFLQLLLLLLLLLLSQGLLLRMLLLLLKLLLHCCYVCWCQTRSRELKTDRHNILSSDKNITALDFIVFFSSEFQNCLSYV